MADLNNGKGKFWGVDENVNYAASFVGATKVAEKVKKGGTEKKSDGYVVDAIDIDWGGLKLTTIDNGWSQKTVSSTEQNAGKGENTQGIHSTAYLLNLISGSFDQIYNQIGGSDNAGLRKKIKDLQTAIDAMADLTPEELVNLKANIEAINKELADPGAAGTMVSILDALVGFDKTKGSVKKYIDDRDKAILGSTADAATAYSVYGVRKYVDTTAKNTLLGASGDAWPTKRTIYGVAKYAEEKASTSYNNAIGAANNYTNQAIGTAESTLIGSTADAATTNTIWGAKNYANTTVKNSLLGATGDQWPTKQTIWGVKNSLLGASGDAWPTQKTLYGVKDYADGVKTASYAKANTAAGNVLGKSGDLWPTQHTVYGVAKYADTTVKNILVGKSTDATTADTIWGAKNYANTTVKNSLIGASTDETTANTIWGAKKYADEMRTASYAKAEVAAGNVLGKDGDLWPTQHTVYGVAKYATTVKNSLLGASGDAWLTKQTIYSVKDYADGVQTASYAKAEVAAGNVLGKDGDLWPTQHTVYGVAKYADEKIKTLSNTAFKVSRIEEGNEGILVFSTVS